MNLNLKSPNVWVMVFVGVAGAALLSWQASLIIEQSKEARARIRQLEEKAAKLRGDAVKEPIPDGEDQAVFSKGASQPSAADGERGILQSIKRQSSGRIRLVGFQKTNAQKGELMGIKFYKMEFEAVIEFTEDCRWWKDDLRGCFMTAPPAEGTGDMTVKKGDAFRLKKGSIDFEETENGWRVVNIKI